MKSFLTTILFCLVLAPLTSASVFLPRSKQVPTSKWSSLSSSTRGNSNRVEGNHDLRWALRQQQKRASSHTAMAIPGYGVAEQVLVGGFGNFLSIYNLVITARILLSWFPQAQGVGILQPVFAITDPYLNLFRGLIPPLFGLDFSPILAFVLLNVLTNATAAVGYEMTPEMQRKFQQQQQQKKRQLPWLRSKSSLPQTFVNL